MAGFDSPKEWQDVLKEQYGTRGGSAIFHIWTAGATATALAALSACAYGVYRWIAQPLFGTIAKTGSLGFLQGRPEWMGVAISAAFSVALVSAATYSLRKWFRQSRDGDFAIMDDFFRNALWPRLDKLEKHSASVHTVESFCNALEKDIRQLREHVNMPEPVLKTMADYAHLARGIGSVGAIVERPESDPKP